MWFSRIISTFFGIRKNLDFQKIFKIFHLVKKLLLFLVVNFVFICIILIITRLITSSMDKFKKFKKDLSDLYTEDIPINLVRHQNTEADVNLFIIKTNSP